jgi:ketosteroid isomerase-like protein
MTGEHADQTGMTGEDLPSQRSALLARFMAAWNAHDLDGLMACMAEDCAFHASAGPDPNGRRHTGREAVRAAYAAIFSTFSDAAWSNDNHVVSGDTGLSSWRFTGTTAAGDKIEVDGCDIFVFSGARIALKDSYRKART